MPIVNIIYSTSIHGRTHLNPVHVKESNLKHLLPKIGADKAAPWNELEDRVEGPYVTAGNIRNGDSYMLLNVETDKLREYIEARRAELV